MTRSMPSVFAKLNLKDQEEILILNGPASFDKEILGLRDVRVRRRILDAQKLSFALVFVTTQSEVERFAAFIAAKSAGDAVVWFAYPKGTSKRYSGDLNRDNGWAPMRKSGFDSVRQVAIDEDWSALRFRRVEFIKRGK
ncbi:MAG: hypothetical protein ACLPX1_15045 [Steroidobacteraceae bacterium]